MEERKTAAVVLGVLALFIVFFTVILPEINSRLPQTLAFKNCTIRIENGTGNDADAYNTAHARLGVCLCSLYKQNRDSAIKDSILKLYKEYGNKDSINYASYYQSIDSIVKYKNKAFADTLILLD